MMFIGLILIGVLIYYLVAGNNGKALPAINRKQPEELLKERFVRGEIDEATYMRMKETISK